MDGLWYENVQVFKNDM
jgi:hypothetical protein